MKDFWLCFVPLFVAVDAIGILPMYVGLTQGIDQARRRKLVAEAHVANGSVSAQVLPQRVPLADPLAGVMGPTNAVTFHTDLVGPVTVVGAGAGKLETAFSVLTDILDIRRALAERTE